MCPYNLYPYKFIISLENVLWTIDGHVIFKCVCLNKKVSCEGLIGRGGGLKYFETSISQLLCRVRLHNFIFNVFA